ncbi:hypothetical protein Tco_0734316 [Tanacetum coccineum]
MDTTKAQQQALDDSLVAPENRLKIGKCNQRLSPTLKSNEPTIQVALDALKLTPFYNAFDVSADVPKIYMQEFWATVTKHHFSLRFKMNGKSHTVNVDNFRDMLKICPKLPGQKFEDPPFKEEILSFIRDLGHTGEIKVLSDVNVNHLHQPWRSFADIINKCLSGKTTALENLVYQVENMNSKKNNDMYYPSFTKVIVDYFMAKDQAIPRNKMFWHYARDDFMFTTIRVISKHQDTQTAATTKGKRLKTSTKAAKPSKKKQPAKTSKAKGADEGTGSKLGVLDVLTYGSDNEQISCMSSDKEDDDEVGLNDNDDNDDDEDNHDDDDDANNQDDDDQEDDGQDDKDQDDVNEQTDSDNDGDDFVHPKLSTQDHEVRHNKEESDEEIQGANVEEEELDEEETNDEDEANELYRDVNVNLEGRDIEMTDAQQTNVQTTQVIEDTHVIITLVNPKGQQQISSVSSGFVSNMLNPSPDTAVSLIPGIVDAYLANKMHEAVKIAVQLQSNRLRDESQAENEDLLNKLDDNIKKIIKDQVKAQVFKILPKNKKTVNEQLKTEVLTRSSNESKTSHNVAANVSKLELKKILIDKMESNKSIHRSDEQKNLYKALDKDEEPFAGSNRGSKRRIAGKELKSTSAPKEKTSKTTGKSTEGSKSHHKSAGESAQVEEPRHTAKDLEELVHLEFEEGVTKDQPDKETSQLPDWFQKPVKSPTPNRDWNKTLPDTHRHVQPWPSSLAQMEDPRESFNELIDTPLDFSTFVMNRLKVDTLTPELLAGPTFKLMKGSCKSLVELEYFFEEVYKATTDQLDWNNPEDQQ